MLDLLTKNKTLKITLPMITWAYIVIILLTVMLYSILFIRAMAESKKQTAAMMWRIDDALIKCHKQLKN